MDPISDKTQVKALVASMRRYPCDAEPSIAELRGGSALLIHRIRARGSGASARRRVVQGLTLLGILVTAGLTSARAQAPDTASRELLPDEEPAPSPGFRASAPQRSVISRPAPAHRKYIKRRARTGAPDQAGPSLLIDGASRSARRVIVRCAQPELTQGSLPSDIEIHVYGRSRSEILWFPLAVEKTRFAACLRSQTAGLGVGSIAVRIRAPEHPLKSPADPERLLEE